MLLRDWQRQKPKFFEVFHSKDLNMHSLSKGLVNFYYSMVQVSRLKSRQQVRVHKIYSAENFEK